MISQDGEEESQDSPAIRESNGASTQASQTLHLGRIFGILFATEPRELDKPQQRQRKPVGKAALSLMQSVKELTSKGLSLDPICVPILEHAVNSRDSSYRKRSVILLRWLLRSAPSCVDVAVTLEAIVGGQQWHNKVKLGWCVLTRELIRNWLSGADAVTFGHNRKVYEIFVRCIPQLVCILRQASVKEGKRRIPTRLSVAAADCLLTITKPLLAGPPAAEPEAAPAQKVEVQSQKKTALITPLDTPTTDNRRSSISWTDINRSSSNVDEEEPSTSYSDLLTSAERRESALWGQLDNLISFIKELEEWNDRDRPLFTKGLRCICERLQLLADYRDSVQGQDGGDFSVGAAVLAACWQHYSALIFIEDKELSTHPQPVLQHWLGALQYYMQQSEEDSGTDEEDNRKKTLEMRGYALACLALVLGRLDTPQLESILSEYEQDLLKAMFGQLREADSHIVDLSVAILRAMLFRPSLAAADTNAGADADAGVARIESVVPMLLDMLDARDVAARAVVLLVAEYFAAHPDSKEMEQLFFRLDSEDSGQRRNALDVLTELLSICTRSVDVIDSSLSRTIATHLFGRLGDTELANRAEVAALFARLDPSFTLPRLLDFLYSPDGRVRSAASTSVQSVLKGQPNQTKVAIELIDCATNLAAKFTASPAGTGTVKGVPGRAKRSRINGRGSSGGGGSSSDVDRVMQLLPAWAVTVEDWDSVIRAVVSKMFEEPENVVIPRFLSFISESLADQVHILFPIVLERMRNQPKLTPDFLSKLNEDQDPDVGGDGGPLGRELFQRLSPLLVLRVLPLRAFSDPNCKELYWYSEGSLDREEGEVCISSLLLDRVCGTFEFDDVRKVAAELMGRLLPAIMIPLVTGQLQIATRDQDLIRVRACLFVLCGSLGIRGQVTLSHPLMGHVCQLLTTILLWPLSPDINNSNSKNDRNPDIGKAQHGCIDCLALMVCAELQPQPQAALSPVSNESSGPPSGRSVAEKLPSPREQTLAEELPILEEIEAGSPPLSPSQRSAQDADVKVIIQLPDAEQLKPHSFDCEPNALGANYESTTSEEDLRRGPPVASGTRTKRLPKLVEELPDKTGKEQVHVTENSANGSSSPLAVLAPVIDCLTGREWRLPWSKFSTTSKFSSNGTEYRREAYFNEQGDSPANVEILGLGNRTASLAFRLCMANVLISASQKVSLTARTVLASSMIFPVVTFIHGSSDSKLRGTCLQVLFTAVYHLKAPAVLPYAGDLFTLSLAAIKCRGLLEERLCGGKLLASLLASEEALVRELEPYLMDAQAALASISAMDSSPELRKLCEQLLSCLSTPRNM